MTRILFVDDEPLILRAFEAVLRKHRNRWALEFVSSGKLALEVLEREAFDIVVTDLRMPGIDGIAVLRHLEQHHPETVRVVLSGGSERGVALAALSVAHQSLAKPCAPHALEALLERACTLRVLVADPEVRRAVGRLRDLPPLPRTHERLTTLLASDDAGLSDVANVIISDIAVSTSVLRLANSAFFGLGRPVGSVAQAVMLLGVETIKCLVLATALFEKPSPRQRSRLLATEVHQHSLLVATLASALADPASRSDAFVAGMLHDVGRLIVEAQLPVEEPFTDDPDHAKVGAYLLALWGLPAAVIDAVAFHHDPSPDVPALAAAIRAAEQIITDVVGDRPATPEEADEMLRLARGGAPLRAAS
jgi:putative nucleotidyltransferase with HDIG domain